MLAARPGIIIRGSLTRLLPASRTRTLVSGSSVKRLATTNPAVPPPTMMKSKGCCSRPVVEDVSAEAIIFQYIQLSEGLMEGGNTVFRVWSA